MSKVGKEIIKITNQQFKRLSKNIDSHDNSLYHEQLKNKLYNKPLNINNFNYSSKALVEDFNKRWKGNITLEEYYENLKGDKYY